MKNEKNIVWRFFASVKLALFTLFALAPLSIIGTIIPQKADPGRYVELYGPNLANIFLTLDFDDMYASWWFTSLLVLFSINITICTIERFPHIWRVVSQDNLKTPVDRIKKMSIRRSFQTSASMQEAEAAVQQVLPGSGWALEKVEKDGGTLFFAQKGAWTRLAVIVVHVSILVIFAGALIGNFFGYKASVMIPEGGETDKVYQANSEHTPIPLGFNLKCEWFSLTYYDTGAPKEYRSDLVVEQNGKTLKEQIIVVNDPMKYGGLTFYQSSYQEMNGQMTAVLKNSGSDAQQRFGIVPRREVKWPTEEVSFGVTNVTGPDFMRKYRYKIWFKDAKAAPVEFWVNEGEVAKVQRPHTTYELMVKPRFATGLQVVKDPGVWTVYIGCALQMLGLMVIFFMAHRRVWVFVEKGDKGTAIFLSGNSNKNKIGFEKDVARLVEGFEEDDTLGIGSGKE